MWQYLLDAFTMGYCHACWQSADIADTTPSPTLSLSVDQAVKSYQRHSQAIVYNFAAARSTGSLNGFKQLCAQPQAAQLLVNILSTSAALCNRPGSAPAGGEPPISQWLVNQLGNCYDENRGQCNKSHCSCSHQLGLAALHHYGLPQPYLGMTRLYPSWQNSEPQMSRQCSNRWHHLGHAVGAPNTTINTTSLLPSSSWPQ